MASIAAARRTQSSYPTFVASTNPSAVTMAVYSNNNGGQPGPNLKSRIEKLPGVSHVVTAFAPPMVPLTATGAPELNTLGYDDVVGSTDGMLVRQDKLGITEGHQANPNSVDQIVLTAADAQTLHVHVGGKLTLGLYLPSQQSLPGFGTPKVKPVLAFHTTVVGIGVLNTQVVQDGVDKVYGFAFITSAMVKKLTSIITGHAPSLYGVQLDPSVRNVKKIEQELVSVVPRGFQDEFHVTSQVVSTTELAIKPESVALGAFGLIAALACLVLAAQAISRFLQRAEEDRRILRSLGASPGSTVAEGMIGAAGSVVVGTLLAVLVAVALSPLGPVGPVRPVYVNKGIAFDWTVLLVGFLVLTVVLIAIAIAVSVRGAPHRVGPQRRESRGSSTVRTLQSAGLSVAGVVGVHFALEPGRGRTAVPVRSVLVGTVLAIAMVVATLTFASGLQTLVSHPALYGWNWNYAINPTNSVPPTTLQQLGRDPDVAAYSGYDYNNAEINGLTLPILLTSTHDKVFPPVLSGHEIDASNQIVLGAATIAQLHKKIGDTVTISYASADDAPIYIPPTKLVIVGIATLPAVGYSTFVAQHTSMGTGAIVPYAIQPPAMVKSIKNADPLLNGPELVFVRLRPHVGVSAGRTNLERITAATNKVLDADKNATGNSVALLSVVQPVQIVNYRSIGSTPIILALGLAVGAVVALGLTLTSSVRRRRRDLALLKTFGFTQRQLSATVTWQATVDAVVGIVVGIPLGIIVGRELWTLFARNINAVPDPTVPLLSVILVGVGALIFTNLVAVLPGRSAARTSTALVLRAE
jgi:ABC-type antimicrobial peptide transport system permease subunit